MTGEEIEAIVNGYHGDAFGILGPHSVRKKNGKPRWEVRAFLPQADSAVVVAGTTRYDMEKRHTQGFFVAAIDGDSVPYVIRARLWEDDYKINRAELPTYGQMLKDQIDTTETAEQIQTSVESGYTNKLY